MSNAKKPRPAAVEPAQSGDPLTAQEQDFMQKMDAITQKAQKAQALADSELSQEEREKCALEGVNELANLLDVMPNSVEGGAFSDAMDKLKGEFANFKQRQEKGADAFNGHLENMKRLASKQEAVMEEIKQSSSLFGVSQAKLQELKQVSQAALSESMTWHQTEERLLTCISKSRAAELDQEIERLRALRRTAIGTGQTSGKEYKQLGTLIAAAQSERADLNMVAQELEQGALERAIAGQELWRTHLERRRELADYYLQGEISACRMEAQDALASALPLLAKLAAKIELRRNILTTLVDYTAPRQPDFSLATPISAATKGEVVGFLAALLPSNTSAVDAAFDQAILAELKQCPPANLIRGDLVNSRAQKIQNLKLQKMQREPKSKPSSAKQRADDLWSFESMQARSKNLR